MHSATKVFPCIQTCKSKSHDVLDSTMKECGNATSISGIPRELVLFACVGDQYLYSSALAMEHDEEEQASVYRTAIRGRKSLEQERSQGGSLLIASFKKTKFC